MASANDARIAVSANFKPCLEQLAENFSAASGHELEIVSGSTGKLYAQIQNGAPFDAFFSADERSPKLLDQQDKTTGGGRFAYARGRLVLWSPTPNYIDSQGVILRRGGFKHLAIANPELAPYGRAAERTLKYLRIWDDVRNYLVRGENIAQTYQFVATGAADLGFVAMSQLVYPGAKPTGSQWVVPQSYYLPIDQYAVLLQDNPAAADFMTYVRSDAAKSVIREYGYDLP